MSKDKVYINIGGWIGTTAMYGSRKSKHVYSIEADKFSFKDLTKNLKTNCENNYTLINKAIYNVNNILVKFGKNAFSENAIWNESSSHIYSDKIKSNDYYLIETVTLANIIESYNIDISNVSIIKVDIEGGEEYILNELFDIHYKYKIPLYISFHYTWWSDKNLNRFSFLSEDIKQYIMTHPFYSILFR